MGLNPYQGLPATAFWKTGVAQENPYNIEGIYNKKFDISPAEKIATAGSCFAQHISHHLKKNGYSVIDVEPAPPGLPEHLQKRFGFSMFSARYGNIYTVRQLLQLAQEAAGDWTPKNYIWEKDGYYFDALRPAVEPEGLESPGEVAEHRYYHIAKVRELFESFDIFIFTLGLTEMWADRASGTVYPTAPGVVIGNFDSHLFEFGNAHFGDVMGDFNHFQETLQKIRRGRPFRIILTVSPVPLTASASGSHVLGSTTYSKAILRSVAGELSISQAHIDYFPAYEIATNPRLHSSSFGHNLRSIREEAVANVMGHFFREHRNRINTLTSDAPEAESSSSKSTTSTHTTEQHSADAACEEMILDSFAPKHG